MNYLRKLKSRKGFTLVELIVVVALIAIIVVCVATFSGPVNSMVNGSKARSDALTINKIMGDYIERRVSFADQVFIYTNCDVTSGGTQCNGGVLDDVLTNVAPTGSKDLGGALVFKFVPDTDEPWKNTYKMYDVPSGTSISDYENYPVFDDAFYGGYEFHVNLDSETATSFAKINGGDDKAYLFNRGKNKFYMGLEIRSYDFKHDGGVALAGNASASTHWADTEIKVGFMNASLLWAHNEYVTGTENVSFVLNNVKRDGSYTDRALPATGCYYKAYGLPKKDDTNPIGWDESGENSGYDMVIFYHITHYDIA